MLERLMLRAYPPVIDAIRWKVIDFLISRHVLAAARCRTDSRKNR